MNKIIFILLSLITIVSCKEKTQEIEITEIKQKNQTRPKTSFVKGNSESIDKIEIMKINIMKFPVVEETSFDTFEESNRKSYHDKIVCRKLKSEQIQKLGLQDWLKNRTNVSINYELPYSTNFRTLVFTFKEGEMELKTCMVTFDKKFKKIDQLQIAYDEIAESWMWTKSKISKNKIEVKEYNESSGETEITTTIYRIDENGKFVTISNNDL